MGQPAYDTDLVSPEGQVVTAKTPDEHRKYAYMGYKPATVADIKEHEIRQVYDNWAGAATAFGRGVMHGLPLFDTATSTLLAATQGGQAASDWAAEGAVLSEVHPAMSALGQLQGAATVALGAGIGAGATTLEQVVTGVAGNVAMGAANTIDRAALAHAIQPGGEEKILAHFGTDVLFDAIVGAAIPLGSAGVSALGRKLGGLTQIFADSQLQKQVFDAKALNTLTQQGRSTQLGSAMDQFELWGLSPSQVTAKIAPKLEQLTTEYKILQSSVTAKLAPTRGAQMVDEVGSILGESHPELAQKLTQQMMDAGHSPTVGELNSMRAQVWKNMDFTVNTPEAALAQQPMMDAGDRIGRELRTLLKDSDVATGGVAAEKWAQLDKDFSSLGLIKDALRKDAAPGIKDYLKQAAKPWYVNLMAHALGAPAIGNMYHAYEGAAAMASAFKNGAFSGPAKALAGVFTQSAQRLTQATQAGLLGAAAEASVEMHRGIVTDDQFELKTAQIRHGMRDPQQSMGAIATATASGGVPGEMSQALALRAHAMSQFLYQIMPKAPTPTFNSGMPSTYKPSPEFRQKWLGVYNTLNDPTYGVLNPTADNLAALKQFYPDTLANVQQAVLQQLHTNHELPLESQTWATRILGYPVGGLTSPEFYTMLQGARQYNAQKAQASAKPQGGNNQQNAVNNLTRVQSLQNRSK
jgi:hypothetical protein